MTVSKRVKRFDIWLVYLYFTDHPSVGKVRPVLIVECDGDRIAAAKITSQPPRNNSVEEFAIVGWHEAGLNAPSTIRCSRVFELSAKELLRDHPIGHLQKEEITGVTEALKNAGFLSTYI